jgi:hypothetical protein
MDWELLKLGLCDNRIFYFIFRVYMINKLEKVCNSILRNLGNGVGEE